MGAASAATRGVTGVTSRSFNEHLWPSMNQHSVGSGRRWCTSGIALSIGWMTWTAMRVEDFSICDGSAPQLIASRQICRCIALWEEATVRGRCFAHIDAEHEVQIGSLILKSSLKPKACIMYFYSELSARARTLVIRLSTSR